MTGEMKVFVAVSNLSTLVGYNKRSTYIFFSQMQRNIGPTPLLAVLFLNSSYVRNAHIEVDSIYDFCDMYYT